MSDGVIHTAFNHDFSKFAANFEADPKVIQALGAFVESDRPLARHFRHRNGRCVRAASRPKKIPRAQFRGPTQRN
jgi:hypothetical protein